MLVAELKIGMVFYFVGTQNIYAVLLDQQGDTREFTLLPCKKAFSLLDKYWDVLKRSISSKSTNSSDFQSFSFEWGHELLPPESALDPFDVLVIVPHYMLHGLPFHTIWLPEKKQFLGITHGICYNSSGTLFNRCVDRNEVRKMDLSRWEYYTGGQSPKSAPEPPHRCLGIGADVIRNKTPDYRRIAETFIQPFSNPKTYGGEDGERSGFPSATRYNLKINNRRKKDEWFQVLCVVCHGYYDRMVPDHSGLLLEKDTFGTVMRPIPLYRGKYFDFRDLPFRYMPTEIQPSCEAELMTVAEMKIDHSTDVQLVALLGCSTGAGYVLAGDDFSSMAIQWLKCGAASVIANLWEADIDFTMKWVPLFLENWLVRRQPKAIAMQQAYQQCLDFDEMPSPYEWGTIALLGDWL
jgi:hypothetical protein